MPIKIEISDPDVEYLTEGAKEEVKESTLKYADGIIKEAGRLEAAFRTDDTNPEITRQIIKDAVTYKNSPYNRPKSSKIATNLQVVSTITLFLSGNLLTYWAVTPEKTVLMVYFTITSIIAITTTILSFVWRDK